MNRRGFFKRLSQAVIVAVAAPYMSFAPMRPRVKRLKDQWAGIALFHDHSTHVKAHIEMAKSLGVRW